MPETVTEPDVLAEIERILLEVIGDDLLLDGPLTMETSFDEDLQLESIEFVALSEKLLETYVELRFEDERFIDTVQRVGTEPFKARVYADRQPQRKAAHV